MSSPLQETTVLRLTVWLNAWRSGHISAFDASNACESITGSLDVLLYDERHPWIDLLATFGAQTDPFQAVLPTFGNPCGISREILATFDFDKGLIVIDKNVVIGSTVDGIWCAVSTDVATDFYDVQFARIALLQALSEAQLTLSHLDLVGSRVTADSVLKDLSFGHVPPSTPMRTTEALELALRISTLARIAREDSAAVSSRSQDHERSRVLMDLERQARLLLQAAASTKH